MECDTISTTGLTKKRQHGHNDDEGNDASVHGTIGSTHNRSNNSYGISYQRAASSASPLAKRALHLHDDNDQDHRRHCSSSNDKWKTDVDAPMHHVNGPTKNDSILDSSFAAKNNDNYSLGSSSVVSTHARLHHQHSYRVRSLTSLYRDNRRTNDEIHSTINLGPVITCIVDTPPMQRLRGLKQLGCAEYVYINVNHNRFEHSLGVATLAETLCRKIRTQQPSLLCTEKDILCVQLAGLLHDIGHGPFSHSYETFALLDFPTYLSKNPHVQKLYNESNWPRVPNHWTHESASLMMIDAALAYLGLAIDLNHLDQPLKQIGNGIDAMSMRATAEAAVHPHSTKNGTKEEDDGDDDDSAILTSRDWIFVKECIWGKPIPDIEAIHGPGFHGRTGEHQDWLYDIVSNRHSGLDVDKVDYYARDRRRALREAGEIDKVVIEEAIVAWAPCTDPTSCFRCRYQNKTPSTSACKTAAINGKIRNNHLMICYPDKMIGASMNFFKTRFELHSIIYKHKTNVGVAYMISDILCLADPHFLVSIAPFYGTAGSNTIGTAKFEYEYLPLSRAMLHPMSYLRLRDSVIDQIEATTCPELEPARKLVHRLWSRDLYKCVTMKVLKIHKLPKDRRIWELSSSGIVKDIVEFKAQHDDGNGGKIQLIEYDVIVDKCQIHHGQKHQDPLANMRFVEKSQLNKISTHDYKELPEAKVVNNDEYDSFLPRSLMECSLRIYCRDTSKVDLLRHAFELWWDSIHDEMEMTVEPPKQQPNIGGNGQHQQPSHDIVILSQESDDEADGNPDGDTNGIVEPYFGGDGSSNPPWCSPY